MTYRPDDPRAQDPDFADDEAARREAHREWAKEQKYWDNQEKEIFHGGE